MALRTRPVPRPEHSTTTYEEYVAARWSALYRTAYLLTGNHTDAEDLAQGTLVKTYLAWDKVADAAAPDAYVRRIMSNLFISSKRGLRVARERLVDTTPDSTVVTEDNHQRLMLWPHIAALPPKQRAVIVLRYYEDLTEQQIADALGCTPGTVKSNASLALRTLRTKIASTEGVLP